MTTTEYIMVAALVADPTTHVYWSALNTPDFDGVFSGYSPSELVLPASIDYSLETAITGTGNAFTQGQAGGDLSGTYPNPTVTGLYGRPVAPNAPLNGTPLVWNAATGHWTPGSALNPNTTIGASGGQTLPQGTIFVGSTAGFPSSGCITIQTTCGPQSVDYTGLTPTAFTGASGGSCTILAGSPVVPCGTSNNLLLPPVINQQFAALIENPAGTPVFSRLTQDMILPSFLITLSGGTNLQVGQTVVHPGFTATYNRAPVTVILTDTDGYPAQNVSSTPNSFNSVNTYAKNTFGASSTFTINATDGTVGKTASTTFNWFQLSFYGIGPAGGNTAAFIHSLSNQFVTGSRGTVFTIGAGAGNYIYFACRAAYGTPTFIVGGFAGGFALVSNTISVTNIYGFSENYQLWVSDNAGLGTTTVTVQ